MASAHDEVAGSWGSLNSPRLPYGQVALDILEAGLNGEVSIIDQTWLSEHATIFF